MYFLAYPLIVFQSLDDLFIFGDFYVSVSSSNSAFILYTEGSHFYLVHPHGLIHLVFWPRPTVAKRLQIMTPPPPCFTVDTMFFSWNIFFFFFG